MSKCSNGNHQIKLIWASDETHKVFSGLFWKENTGCFLKSPIFQVLQGIIHLLLLSRGAHTFCNNIAIYDSLDPVYRELTFCLNAV